MRDVRQKRRRLIWKPRAEHRPRRSPRSATTRRATVADGRAHQRRSGVLRTVLEAVGFTVGRRAQRRALLSLLLQRLQIRLRGLDFDRTRCQQIPESDLVRIDICWAGAAGLGAVDLIRGADFQSRHLLAGVAGGRTLSRCAGDFFRSRANRGARWSSAEARGANCANRPKTWRRKWDTRMRSHLSIWASGVAAYLVGHWKQAADVVRTGGGNPARSLHRRDLGTDHRASLHVERAVVPGRTGRSFAARSGLLSAALEQGNLFARHRICARA